MSVLQSLLLGVIQGATEFLPVSSSAHLFLAQKLLGLSEPELAFDTLLHLGTFFAVVVFLRKELGEIVGALLGRYPVIERPAWGTRDIGLVLLSTIPTVIIGLAFHDIVETQLTVRGIGARYLVLTVFLLMSNLKLREKWNPESISWWEAVLIGTIQGLAVFPGLSRSGSTITLALLLGISAARAPKYSFLISLPAIFGAALLNLRKIWASVLPGPVVGLVQKVFPFIDLKKATASTLPAALPSILGFFAALAVGYLALFTVDRLVVRGRFNRFAPYTFLLAVLCFYLSYKGMR